jgi:hypothetical protein
VPPGRTFLDVLETGQRVLLEDGEHLQAGFTDLPFRLGRQAELEDVPALAKARGDDDLAGASVRQDEAGVLFEEASIPPLMVHLLNHLYVTMEIGDELGRRALGHDCVKPSSSTYR